MKMRFSFFPVALATLFLLAGCDVLGSEDTVILNAGSSIPPTVDYTFEYTPEDINNSGQVEVTSTGTDDLGSILSDNGFSREDIVSARVDSVSLQRLSSPSSAGTTPKVFSYLVGAEVFLGQDANGTRIADDEFQTTQRFVSLNVVTRDVTSIVQSGSTRAFLRLNTDNPDEIPSTDRVRATVYFQLELEGV